ncbi:response regulator [Lacipirellula parvula]|uniref:Chemotaxis regulator-transmits chemoreceptor signals to flagellar motor components CheY n=1 Tax=Lacipirellula parvula TaxID=2650471 RepID=A0A5K7X5W0_9BACT|nr:response regulator [Lacipirellula parvula]BBO31202.1 chemotaxis regulator - transmits chemoreceptor signals to flagellar motor components CheY [Lacipirellula parvula]
MSHTLLVTDDSMIVREMIKDLAIEAGWTVVGEAVNGQQAIEKYHELRPDAMTLDLVMPEYDGLHALRGVRALDPRAKILVVSAIDQTDVLQEALKLGAADFIVKPFAKDRAQRALATLFGEKPILIHETAVSAGGAK